MTKKKQSKKTVPATKTSTEIVVKVQPVAAVRQADLVPEQTDGGKFRVVKSWLSDGQVLRMIQKTPANIVKVRKGRGNMEFKYVPGWYFKKALNFAFGWNWDFQIVKQELVGQGTEWAQIITTGRLTVKDDRGHNIVKEDNGKADVKYLKNTKTPLDIGNDYKASATDALKRCCVQLGIASDVYGADEHKHETGEDVIDVTSQTELPPPQKGPEGNDVYLCEVCDSVVGAAGAKVSKSVTGKILCKQHYDEFINNKKK